MLEYFQSAKKSKGEFAKATSIEIPANKALYQEIKDNQEKCLNFADEKLVVIEQAEREIESYLLLIDKQISRFQKDMREQAIEQKVAEDESKVEVLPLVKMSNEHYLRNREKIQSR